MRNSIILLASHICYEINGTLESFLLIEHARMTFTMSSGECGRRIL
jgi:hypothetical protein